MGKIFPCLADHMDSVWMDIFKRFVKKKQKISIAIMEGEWRNGGRLFSNDYKRLRDCGKQKL